MSDKHIDWTKPIQTCETPPRLVEFLTDKCKGLLEVIRMAATGRDGTVHPYIQSRSGSMIHVAHILEPARKP